MELELDYEQKRRIRSMIIRQNRLPRILTFVYRLMIGLSIGGGVLYGLLHCFVPSWSVVNYRGELIKDIGSIVFNSIMIIAVGLFLALIGVRGFVRNIASRNIFDRIEENLVIFEDHIRYAFRLRRDGHPAYRYLVTIPLGLDTTYSHDPALRMITFWGAIVSTLVDTRKPAGQGTMTEGFTVEFTIYDYFRPGLGEKLGIHFPD